MDDKTRRLIEEGSSDGGDGDKLYIKKLARDILCGLIANPVICPQTHVGATDMVEASFHIAESFQAAAKKRYG